MASFRIQGGTPLNGSVTLGGAKNSSYKIMIAALLAEDESRLLSFSKIADVKMVAEVIASLGAGVRSAGERTMFIDPSSLTESSIADQYGKTSRASTLFIGPLLARFGKASVPTPGGDNIGKRPLDRHFDGLKAMGVAFEQRSDRLNAVASHGLHGVTYRFAKNTHTGTETLIMAAVRAQGTTVLENAAEEPEVDDLITFLNAMGARIRRRAFRVIEIEGVPSLHGAIHQVMPDRNEAVSYACAAIATKGDIIVQNARADHLRAFLAKLEEAGAGYEVGDYGIRFFSRGPLRATDVETAIHPGFMTDWQPLWATLICHAELGSNGQPPVSIIHETIYESRFQYVKSLKAMGANIEEFHPVVANPEETYNFNLTDANKDQAFAIKIYGPTHFRGGEFTVHDLREGATLLLAALSGEGTTILHNIEQIDRGYEVLDERLRSMGALITRQTD